MLFFPDKRGCRHKSGTVKHLYISSAPNRSSQLVVGRAVRRKGTGDQFGTCRVSAVIPGVPMGQFTADLHIHSRYSRATSKSLTPSLLAAWAAAKGIDVLATGDFTHPAWLAEIEETLREDGSGLLVPR